MPVNPYLNFAGNCREAMEYYADVFHAGKPQIMTFGEMPGDPTHPLPEAAKNLVLHARIVVEGTEVMASDTFPGMPVNVGNNVALAVVSRDRNVIQNAFDRLKEGGTVHMDLQQTFWSPLYANLRDKFGTEWQLSYDTGETTR